MRPGKKLEHRPPPKRIFLVDDHPVMREGISQLIAAEVDLAVCGEAGDAADALLQIEKLKPDLAVVDLILHSTHGFDLIKQVGARSPSTAVLVLSMHDESFYAERVLRAGGRGYIMKQEGGKKLMAAMRHVLAGGTYVSEEMTAKILTVFAGQRSDSSSPVEKLTAREFEVFEFIGEGLSTREIAAKLHLSVKTVEVHRVRIKRKLSVTTANALIHCAMHWVNSQKPP